MKKLVLLSIVLIFVNSCKAIKLVKDENLTSHQGYESFEIDKNKMLMHSRLNDTLKYFMFDTGANGSFLIDSSIIKELDENKMVKFGAVKTPNGKVDRTMVSLKLENNFIKSTNKVFAFLPDKINNICDQYYSGVLGLDVFDSNDDTVVKPKMLMDFENFQIGITDIDTNSLIENGYYKIKSKHSWKGIYIFININGLEYPFKLDTGFSGYFVMPFDKELNFLTEPHTTYVGGAMHTAIGGVSLNNEDNFYNDLNMQFEKKQVKYPIIVSNSIQVQNVGLGFIKNYNWYIDFENEEVYVKNLKTDFDISQISYNKYVVKIEDNKLIIAIKTKGSELTVASIVLAVNNVYVNSENICYYKDLLNKTENWDDLNITFEK